MKGSLVQVRSEESIFGKVRQAQQQVGEGIAAERALVESESSEVIATTEAGHGFIANPLDLNSEFHAVATSRELI